MNNWTSPHGTPLPEIGSRTLIMGILNVTPDSFSDGGKFQNPEQAAARAVEMVEEGADVIDIGGESTRPGSSEVAEQEEIKRVIPVIEEIRKQLPQTPLSVDTYKSVVAEKAIDAGADMVNDVWGLKGELSDIAETEWIDGMVVKFGEFGDCPPSPMACVLAEKKCPIIIMHNREGNDYTDFWQELLVDVKISLAMAKQTKIPDNQIWLDPGFGFGKEIPHNLEVVKYLSKLKALDYPVLLGTSRKSTLGAILDKPVDQRFPGTAATAVWAISQGANMVRVHEVKEIKPFVDMADAIKQGIEYGDMVERLPGSS